jgi:citrate synthase
VGPDAADNSREASIRKAMRLTAQMPTLVAAWERIRRGKAPVAPNPKLSLSANFLYMMSGKKPTELAVKTFDVALILHADHEFNASTFAARVTAATMSTCTRRSRPPSARSRGRCTAAPTSRSC